MASISVWTCPSSSAYTRISARGELYPTCDAGQAVWTQVELAEPFDPSTLNSDELSGAFGAGFVVVGTGLVIAWAARQVVSAIRAAL